jgi:protocatechuate 3,4-dioxygenase beta subunit
MRDKKLPLLVGLLLLVVIGFVIGLVLMQNSGSGPQPRANKLIADNDTERGDTPANTDNTQPREPEVDDTPPAPVRVGGDKPVVAPQGAGLHRDQRVGHRDRQLRRPPLKARLSPLLRLDDNASTGPTAVTDADGKFLFIDVQAAIGEAHVVACLMEGKALSATEPFTVQADKPTEGLSLRIYDQARAYGEVLNGADSTPLEGVSIEVDGRSALEQRLGKLLGRVKPVVSNAQGRFEVTALAPGNYLMRAVKKGWTASEINPMTRAVQQCELGEYANFELLPFILLEAGIVEGRVIRKADRAPLVGATVELGSLFGGALATTTTDEEGKFQFDTVPPGIAPPGNEGDAMGGLMLRAFAPGYAVGQRNVRVRSGQRREITIEMDPGCTVTGKVINNKSEPVAGASVYFNDNDFQRGGELIVGVRTPPRAVSTTTDENGNFSLGGVPAGPQGITASAEGYANTTSQVTLDPVNTGQRDDHVATRRRDFRPGDGPERLPGA